jgi:hypothetical protein
MVNLDQTFDYGGDDIVKFANHRRRMHTPI